MAARIYISRVRDKAWFIGQLERGGNLITPDFGEPIEFYLLNKDFDASNHRGAQEKLIKNLNSHNVSLVATVVNLEGHRQAAQRAHLQLCKEAGALEEFSNLKRLTWEHWRVDYHCVGILIACVLNLGLRQTYTVSLPFTFSC